MSEPPQVKLGRPQCSGGWMIWEGEVIGPNPTRADLEYLDEHAPEFSVLLRARPYVPSEKIMEIVDSPSIDGYVGGPDLNREITAYKEYKATNHDPGDEDRR